MYIFVSLEVDNLLLTLMKFGCKYKHQEGTWLLEDPAY